MGLIKKLKKLFGGVDDAVEQVAANAWDAIEDSVDKAVAMFKDTDAAVRIMNLISAVSNRSMSGAEKFNFVLDAAKPIIKDFADDGKLNATADAIEDFARQVVQSIYNDFNKAGGLTSILSPLIALIRKAL